MKKILSLVCVMAFGVTITFAQSAATTTTDTKQVEAASPVIKAVEAEQGMVKCAGTTGTTGSCCSHGSSRSAAATTTNADGTAIVTDAVTTPEASATATETTGEVKAENAASCHQVSIGVSAAKPEPVEKTEDPKK